MKIAAVRFSDAEILVLAGALELLQARFDFSHERLNPAAKAAVQEARGSYTLALHRLGPQGLRALRYKNLGLVGEIIATRSHETALVEARRQRRIRRNQQRVGVGV